MQVINDDEIVPIGEGGLKNEDEDKIKAEGRTQPDGEEEEDIFKGPLEEFKEVEYIGDFDKYESDTKDLTEQEINSSMIINKRSQLFKYYITRQKKEFEAPITLYEKEPGSESNTLDIKPTKPNEYAMTERAILDIEIQTANESSEKTYQVPKVRLQNNFTNTSEDIIEIMERSKNIANYYLTNETQYLNV